MVECMPYALAIYCPKSQLLTVLAFSARVLEGHRPAIHLLKHDGPDRLTVG
jgi:hypothetical protein